MRAKNHAGGEKKENDDAKEEEQIAAIDNAALEAFVMGHYTDSGERIDYPSGCPIDKDVGDGRPAAKDQK